MKHPEVQWNLVREGKARTASWLMILMVWHAIAGVSYGAANLQLVSAPGPFFTAPAGGNGNSDLPIVSADGRYVVFASIAANLITNPNAGPVSGLGPHCLQVFVRDRVRPYHHPAQCESCRLAWNR